MLEDPGIRSPDMPPAAGEASHRAGELNAENQLMITGTTKNQQGKSTGTRVILLDDEEPDARLSQDESPQQQGQQGAAFSRGENIQTQGLPGQVALCGESHQQRKMTEDVGPKAPELPPFPRGTLYGTSKVKTESGTRR